VRHRRAFTILEVLAALALLGILVSLMVGSMNTVRTRSDWVRDRSARHHEVSVAIDRLSTALRTTMVDAPGVGAGVRGSETQVVVLTRTGSIDPAMPGDVASFELRADLDDGVIRGGWKPVLGDGDVSAHELGRGVLTRFRYHDGDAWRTSYDSVQSRRLPSAVEISVWFRSSKPELSEPSESEYPQREPDRRRVLAIADAKGGA